MSTGLTPWYPFRDLDRFLRRFEPFSESGDTAILPVNVTDEGEHYLVRAEVPGVPLDDVEVFIDGNILTLRGEKRSEKTERTEKKTSSGTKEDSSEGKKQPRALYSEISYGAFERTLRLPDDIDSEQIEASGKNGVLFITLGKTHSQPKKRISVKTSESTKVH